MQTSEFGNSKGLWDTLSEGTWHEAFDGLGISLLLTTNPTIQYTLFDQLKLRLVKETQNKTVGKDSSPVTISALSAFLLGAAAKCIATCVTYPAIRCKVTIQAADDGSIEDEAQRKERKTISGSIREIWGKEGLLGFYKGLQAQILKTVLSSALLLMIKEKTAKTTWFLLLALRRYLFVSQPKLKSV